MLKSFIVTGASATGKSTLLKNVVRFGYRVLPSYTTRQPRLGEKDGEDYVFLSEADFLGKNGSGEILEEDVSSCFIKDSGVYYGTPSFWVSEVSDGGVVGIAMTLPGAEKLHHMTGVAWFHLVCSEIERYTRLRYRGHTDEEIGIRLHTGMWFRDIPKCAIILDTSETSPTLTAQDILNMVGI